MDLSCRKAVGHQGEADDPLDRLGQGTWGMSSDKENFPGKIFLNKLERKFSSLT